MGRALLNFKKNEPSVKLPEADAGLLEDCFVKQAENDPDGTWLIITCITPYIDAFLLSDDHEDPESKAVIARFTFMSGYYWDIGQQAGFEKYVLKNENLKYSHAILDEIYEEYSFRYPEWRLQGYYTKSVKVLDQIYNCMHMDTVKEILYKAGLDELAFASGDIDELNLLAGKPSDIYDGLSMRTLRALNCEDGARLLLKKRYRRYIQKLADSFPDMFETELNNAQCRYIKRLIDGELTPSETGRLFRERRKALEAIWCESQYEFFLKLEIKRDVLKELADIDDIYREFIEKQDMRRYIKELSFFLLDEKRRGEYDRKIRRIYRKKRDFLEETEGKYSILLPWTINDFCREAVYMQNCLMSYIEAVVNGDTEILFMRRADDEKKPFITIEVYQNRLEQAYHRYNSSCTEEEREWLRAYCARKGIAFDGTDIDFVGIPEELEELPFE
ncbi:MAG: PcfJ domain-containing protein [Lachnospiraceae bacterium]|nr:PcfJ domain-containing protein [Lachnospiraceae bacterium]